MSGVRKLASQTILYGFTYFAGRLLNFLLTPLFTYIFLPAEYGVISLLYANIVFFNVVYSYGMETGYFYFANNRPNEPVGSTSLASIFSTTLIFSFILCLFAAPLANWIGIGGHSEYIIFAALILAFDAFSVIPFAYLRKNDRPVRFALLKLLNIGSNIFFNLFFMVFCPYILKNYPDGFLGGLISTIYIPDFSIQYVFISNILSSFLIVIMLIPEFLSIRFNFSAKLWKSMLNYSWPILILGFAGMINETIDRDMLNFRLPLSETERLKEIGIYSACYKLSIFMTLAIASFRYAAEPFFFSRMKEAGGKEIFARVLKYFSFVTSLIFLGILFFLPIIIHVIGKNFREGLEVVPVLLMANLFLGMFYYLSQWYKQTEKTLLGAMISIIGAIITLVINYLFIPKYGYMASAWATFACYAFMAIASYLLGLRFYPVNYNVGRIVFYIGSAVALYFISLPIQSFFLGGQNILQYSMRGNQVSSVNVIAVYTIHILIIIAFTSLFLWLERKELFRKFKPVNIESQNN